jgi:putative lipase involved disintegration of autophagic bodies
MIDPHLILRMKDNLMVHLGFRQYLYGKGTIALKKVQSHNKDTTETANESGENEIYGVDKKLYQVILDMVSAVLKDHPGYELFVCGHSLGGALATMLGKYFFVW